ncbi:uncharacterized protein [Haliotis cracherodii]|uniref:uncharacterized protein n=1 Tax=Haliotis cracherodii TaxID=6455 RepID=UPI0039E9A0B1
MNTCETVGAFGGSVHIVGKVDSQQSLQISCPKLQLDSTRANTWQCHVNTEGELVNSQPVGRQQEEHSGRLRKYRGTCSSTPILVTPNSSNPDCVPAAPRYWETLSDVTVEVGVGWPALEVSVVEKKQVDRNLWTCYQPRSWSICVVDCPQHRCICTRVYDEGWHILCSTNTMSNAPCTQVTLSYGVVLDVWGKRLAFIDLNNNAVLAKFYVSFTELLYPMFGVGSRECNYTVQMKLVSGEAIEMTDTKKALIYTALT